MSIQDDIFDLEDFFKSKRKPSIGDREAFGRILDWAIENENENEKLRPIVNGMRNAISAMFEKEEE